MTRKLLLTAAIVALALTPSIGTGTAQARGFGGGGFGGGFHGGFGGGFSWRRVRARLLNPLWLLAAGGALGGLGLLV